MLKIVDFIKSHKNWEEILAAEPYALKIKTKGDLILFNYNQYASDPEEEIVKEARGLILEKDSWNIVRYGFRRFMNLGERGCDELDWESVKASSKEDGTLIFIYFYEGWHVGTRSTFDAEEAELQSIGYKNFRELFDEVAAQYRFDFSRLDPKCTYCLEMCSPSNRIVLSYNEPKLFHILTRDNTTLEELNVDIGIPKPQVYFLGSEEEYKELVNSFDETHEGIVLQDKDNHRTKLKTLSYFELHRMVSNHQITTEFVVDKIRSGEDGEFLVYFGKQYQQIFDSIRKELALAKGIVENAIEQVRIWRKLNPAATRKDFSDFAKMKDPSILWFKAYDGTAEEWFKNLSTGKLISIFKIG